METQRILAEGQVPAEGYLIPLTRSGETITLGQVCIAGRDPHCQLTLTDPFASGRHARFERRADGYFVRDLQSRNGTYLNGSKVTEAGLALGDKIQFGETVYMFALSNASDSELTSKNESWNSQLRRIPAFASTDFPVLITGPSGSGKEVISRALHSHSQRNEGPFIGINCSALSEHLIESELFGHMKGSFTGATNDRKGAFEAARGGTLFLDEIGDLPLALQPKLLRALESKEIRPVGSDKAIATDVRVIAATHQNLSLAIREGRFREDLYYRLNVCNIRPPALRDRKEDFDDLILLFSRQFKVRFSHECTRILRTHNWSGNIRELKNLVARASAYYPGQLILADDLKMILEPSMTPPEVHFVSESEATSTRSRQGANAPSASIIKEIEREMIIRRLRINRGNQRRTAIDLGIPKSTLSDRIKHYAIDVKRLVEADMAGLA